MSIEIIRAEAYCLEGIMAIERQAFDPPWSEENMCAELTSPDVLCLAAMDGETVAGFCILHRSFDEGEIYQIAVPQTHRRQGIADRLLRCAVELAAESGVRSVFLEVRAGNAPAIALYQKHGFKWLGRRKNYYDNPVEDAEIMRLDIDEMERQV